MSPIVTHRREVVKSCDNAEITSEKERNESRADHLVSLFGRTDDRYLSAVRRDLMCCHHHQCVVPVNSPEPAKDTPRSWDDATPMELLEAKVEHLQESVWWLVECLTLALRFTAVRDDAGGTRPEDVLSEEWGK